MKKGKPNNRQNQSWREFVKQSNFYITWIDRLSNIAKSSFRWENCPKGFKPKYMEELLYEKGIFGAYSDPDFDLIAQPVEATGTYNIYDEPTKYRVDNKYIHRNLSAEDVIICRNNSNNTPSAFYVENYAERLAAIEYSMDCNLEQQLFSHLITCDEKDRLSIINIIAQVQTGRPVIMGNTTLKERIEEIPLNSPFIADRLMDIYHSTYHDCLRFFGIRAAGEDKKERVQSAEVEASNGELSINIEIQLKYRREFCEKVNKKFGTKIKVEFVANEINMKEKETSLWDPRKIEL